ncbi:MAG TPA: hypothetical protein VN371_05050 [Chlorobaculum sp.]|nr:hypothetical protein [Chlorobaculum sp.]
MQELLQHIVENPVSSILLIFNHIPIESLLSVDRGAFFGPMSTDMPSKELIAVVMYAITGVYLFRGLFLFSAMLAGSIWWFKHAGLPLSASSYLWDWQNAPNNLVYRQGRYYRIAAPVVGASGSPLFQRL